MYRGSPRPYDYPSPPTDSYGVRLHNYRMQNRQGSPSYDEYQLSPPFSPSPSPSPPTYFCGGNPMQTRIRSETAPVTIPHSVMGKSSRNLSPNFSDPSRNSLPPLSIFVFISLSLQWKAKPIIVGSLATKYFWCNDSNYLFNVISIHCSNLCYQF